jgi:hypothetical protein
MQKQSPVLSLTLAKDNLCHTPVLLFPSSKKRINRFEFDTKVSNIRLSAYTVMNTYPKNTKNEHRLS